MPVNDMLKYVPDIIVKGSATYICKSITFCCWIKQ